MYLSIGLAIPDRVAESIFYYHNSHVACFSLVVLSSTLVPGKPHLEHVIVVNIRTTGSPYPENETSDFFPPRKRSLSSTPGQ